MVRIEAEGTGITGIQQESIQTPHTPHDRMLRDFRALTGLDGGLTKRKSTDLLCEFTGKKSSSIGTNLSEIQEIIGNVSAIQPGIISPEEFMYLYRRTMEGVDLLNRFGWVSIDMNQAAKVLSAISRSAYDRTKESLCHEMSMTYPTIGKAFLQCDHTKRSIGIPASYFLNQFDTLITPDEKEQLENAIKTTALSPTEYARLILLTQGYPNAEIAKGWDSSGTRNVNSLLFRKLHACVPPVRDLAQAAILSLRSGLVPLRITGKHFNPLSTWEIRDLYESLSSRKREILGLLTQGMNAAEIARELGITKQIVKNHLGQIYLKLGCGKPEQRSGIVNSRVHALYVYFLLNGFTPISLLPRISKPKSVRMFLYSRTIPDNTEFLYVSPAPQPPSRQNLPVEGYQRETILPRNIPIVISSTDELPYDGKGLVCNRGHTRDVRLHFPSLYQNPQYTTLFSIESQNTSFDAGENIYAYLHLLSFLSLPMLHEEKFQNDLVELFIAELSADSLISDRGNIQYYTHTQPDLEKSTYWKTRLDKNTENLLSQVKAIREFLRISQALGIDFPKRPRYEEIEASFQRIKDFLSSIA